MRLNTDNLWHEFGFQLTIENINWVEILLKQVIGHKKQLYQYYFYRKELLEHLELVDDDFEQEFLMQKIKGRFIELTNSGLLERVIPVEKCSSTNAVINSSGSESSDTSITAVDNESHSKWLIIETTRPLVKAGCYKLSKLMKGLVKSLVDNELEFNYVFTSHLSGSWVKKDSIFISLPYTADYKDGSTIYHYNSDNYKQLCAIFNVSSTQTGPEKQTLLYDERSAQKTVEINDSCKLSMSFSYRLI